MSSLIDERSDILHEAIFEMSKSAQDLNFPIRRIVEYLEAEGYVKSDLDTTHSSTVLRRDGKKVTISSKSICFERIQPTDKSRFYQKFNSYIISRSKIFLQSAIQNDKSSKMNLIQGQKRTCVSNMYYAIHNCFASLVENSKSESIMSNDLFEKVNGYNDEESMLGHFTPNAFEVFVNKIDEVIDEQEHNEVMLLSGELNSGKMKSYENPFAWITYLFFGLFEDEDFTKVLSDMEASLNKVSLENVGIEAGQRRSNFEKQLKDNVVKVRGLCQESNVDPLKRKVLMFAGYLCYAYMLRQSADYDVLFEVKIDYQDIINWTITTSNFTNFVIGFLNEEVKDGGKIQTLDAVSSTDFLQELNGDNEIPMMTVSGIIQKRDFDLIEFIIKLHNLNGYKMVDRKGRVSELTLQSNATLICRVLFGIPIICYISISSQGLFKVDVYMDGFGEEKLFRRGINFYYLEKLIEREILQNDFLAIMDGASIVKGLPAYFENFSENYFDLVTGIHDSFRFRFNRDINTFLEEQANLRSVKNTCVVAFYYANNVNSILLRNRTRRHIEKFLSNDSTDANGTRFINILFIPSDKEIDTKQKQKLLENILRDFPNISMELEFVYLNDYELSQLVQNNFQKLAVTIEGVVNKGLSITNEKTDDGIINEFIDDLMLSDAETTATIEENEVRGN